MYLRAELCGSGPVGAEAEIFDLVAVLSSIEKAHLLSLRFREEGGPFTFRSECTPPRGIFMQSLLGKRVRWGLQILRPFSCSISSTLNTTARRLAGLTLDSTSIVNLRRDPLCQVFSKDFWFEMMELGESWMKQGLDKLARTSRSRERQTKPRILVLSLGFRLRLMKGTSVW